MAKILIVKDNTDLSGHNVGDVVATYDDNANIYQKDDFLNLQAFRDLETAISGGDKAAILNAKMVLAQKICKKEQYLILTDIFDVVEFESKTLNELQTDIQSKVPERKTVWVDPKTNVAKELKSEPAKTIRYEDGEFKHNLDTDDNKVIING